MRLNLLLNASHSRVFNLALAFAAAIAAVMFYASGHIIPLSGDKGLVLPSANTWIHGATGDFAAGLAGSTATIVVMLMLNKVFNVLRSMTSLFIGLFAMMQLATPDLLGQFYTGTLLALVIPVCIFLLFSCYRDPGSTRHIFLIFFLLSGFSTTQYCFLLYVPAFLIGCAQMRIFNLRTITAALMGLVTPWWILCGFGLIDFENFDFPSFTSILSTIGADDAILLLITVGTTAGIMLLFFILNFMKTIAYNARARAINGVFIVTALSTVIAMAVDFTNILSYVPMLNFCAALEATHYLSTHRADKSVFAILILIAVYAALFACQTVI